MCAAACDDPGAGAAGRAALSGGPASDAGSPAPYCTYSIDYWRDHCADIHADGVDDICRALRSHDDARAEVAALELNVIASDRGVTPAGLGDLRFITGTRTQHDVREWADLCRDARRGPDPVHDDVLHAAFDINHNYENCLADLGALAPTASAPMCDHPSISVQGPAPNVCGGLDSECGRGVQDPTGCCNVAPRPSGVLCQGGYCDGSGACRPDRAATSDDRDQNGQPDRRQTVVGEGYWVEHLESTVPPTAWFVTDGAQISFDGTQVATILRDHAPALDLSTVHIARAVTGPIIGMLIAADGTPGRRTARLPGGGSTTVCVAQGEIDQLGTIRSDCTTPGTTTVSCPSSTHDISCTIDPDGTLVVTADTLAAAWIQPPASTRVVDVHTAIDPPFCLVPIYCGPGFNACSAGCTPGGIAAPCTTPCGAHSIERCLLNGCAGTCLRPASETEVCDGIDNNCNGLIDENALACDDHIACTLDPCFTGGCGHTPVDPMCNTDHASCTIDLCNRAPVEPLSIYNALPGSETGPDLNGCYQAVNHHACQDHCVCDGNESCSPTTPGADPTTGCISTSPGVWPCENDMLPSPYHGGPVPNLCTTWGCCESGDSEAPSACPTRLSADALNTCRTAVHPFYVPFDAPTHLTPSVSLPGPGDPDAPYLPPGDSPIKCPPAYGAPGAPDASVPASCAGDGGTLPPTVTSDAGVPGLPTGDAGVRISNPSVVVCSACGGDGNPCTVDLCAPATGACVGPLPVGTGLGTAGPASRHLAGPQPGCRGLVNGGCATQACVTTAPATGGFFSACVQTPTSSVSATTPTDDGSLTCTGHTQRIAGVPTATCATNFCLGSGCFASATPSLCDDGNPCDGVEICSTSGAPAALGLPYVGCSYGIAPCPDDHITCTFDCVPDHSSSLGYDCGPIVDTGYRCPTPPYTDNCSPTVAICDPTHAVPGTSGCVAQSLCPVGEMCTPDGEFDHICGPVHTGQ